MWEVVKGNQLKKKTATQQSIISTECQNRSVGFWEAVLSWFPECCFCPAALVSARHPTTHVKTNARQPDSGTLKFSHRDVGETSVWLAGGVARRGVGVGGRDGAHIGSLFISSHVTGLTRHRSGLIPALSRPNRRTEGLCSVALPSFPGHYRL